MEMVELTCEVCGKAFQRHKKEHTRCQKRGFHIACGRSCGVTLRNRACPPQGDIKHFKGYTRQDQYSPFRYYVNKARRREAMYGPTDITVEYLKSLWESQGGKCPYTGFQMELPYNTRDHHIRGIPKRASLDRIDSSKGYVQGNVEFVCLVVNYAKNGFSKQEILEFFRAIPLRSFTLP